MTWTMLPRNYIRRVSPAKSDCPYLFCGSVVMELISTLQASFTFIAFGEQLIILVWLTKQGIVRSQIGAVFVIVLLCVFALAVLEAFNLSQLPDKNTKASFTNVMLALHCWVSAVSSSLDVRNSSN